MACYVVNNKEFIMQLLQGLHFEFDANGGKHQFPPIPPRNWKSVRFAFKPRNMGLELSNIYSSLFPCGFSKSKETMTKWYHFKHILLLENKGLMGHETILLLHVEISHVAKEKEKVGG